MGPPFEIARMYTGREIATGCQSHRPTPTNRQNIQRGYPSRRASSAFQGTADRPGGVDRIGSKPRDVALVGCGSPYQGNIFGTSKTTTPSTTQTCTGPLNRRTASDSPYAPNNVVVLCFDLSSENDYCRIFVKSKTTSLRPA